MKPIPVVFHIGPLQIHTYGIGLAITFWFAYRYFGRRLRRNGIPTDWLPTAFVWIIVASIVGARVVHVVANFSFYRQFPGQIIMVWHGGLSSFGGLAGGIAVGIWQTRKGCPQLAIPRALDLVAPVLMASWGIGRLLGPLMMVNGGGRPCSSWYCVQFANGAGGYTPRELPAPVFQSIESFAVFAVLLQIERWVTRQQARGVALPDGMLIAGLFAFWGMARFFDELLWLDIRPPFDAVEVTGIVLSVSGFLAMALLWSRRTKVASGDPDAPGSDGDLATADGQAAAVSASFGETSE